MGQRASDHLPESIHIVGEHRHYGAVRMRVEVAQRQAHQVVEGRCPELPYDALFNLDHQEVEQERRGRAHQQYRRQLEQRHAQRRKVRIRLFRQGQDVPVDERPREERHRQRTEGGDHDQDGYGEQRPFPVAEHMFQQSSHG